MQHNRETLGQEVRKVWVAWAEEQDNPKPHWLLPWEALTEPDREVDRRIGENLYMRGWVDGYAHMPELTQDRDCGDETP